MAICGSVSGVQICAAGRFLPCRDIPAKAMGSAMSVGRRRRPVSPVRLMVEDFRYHVSVLMKMQGECPGRSATAMHERVHVPSERALSGHDQTWHAESLGVRLFSQQGLSRGCSGGFRDQIHFRGVKSMYGSKSGRFPRS